MGRGLHRGSVLNKGVMGGQSGRKDQDSDFIPHLPLPRATASVMGTWPDLIQHFGQSLLFPGFIVKQALVQHSLPVKHPVGLVRSLWVELEQLEPTEAQWEGEGTEVWEENWVSGAEPGVFHGTVFH